MIAALNRRWRATRGRAVLELVAADRQAARRTAVLALQGVLGDLEVTEIAPIGVAS